ncbi:uncharacterized protein LOC121380045 isoform X2 [Gigantopelta aegis]|uniref:uncharacterized protein LOC121380045 isoform X2 n=1 Tax=Gigantopelta aegis TaxID=1735272 RepID=UPI001B8886B0|nr:uncharacterized protein LOC121380045 isoform X2 [Gigantopelta aegis]
MSIAEVERLWMRFQQLGCNREGVITEIVLKTEPQIKNDAFVRNIFKNMKSRNGAVSFESFLRALKWTEIQDTQSKVKAIFHLLNNGKPVDKNLFTNIISKLYPEAPPQETQRIAELFFKQMDKDLHGELTEDQWILVLMRLPRDQLNHLLNFHIMPEDMRERVHRNLPEFNSRNASRLTGYTPANQGLPTYRTGNVTISPPARMTVSQVPSDALLRDVADMIKGRDWDLVANKLGFLQEDISNFRQIYPDSSYQQVYQMLREWKLKEGGNARVDVLERALREGGMVDASLALGP